MSKYTPIKLTQLSANESAAVDAINQNLDSIKEHIDDSLSRSAKSPSQMQADLDMNGQKILNIGTPTKDTDLVRVKDVVADKEEIKTLVNTASVAVAQALEAAETATSAAADMSDQVELAKSWATKTNGPVEDGEYSSKWYAEQIIPIASDISAVAAIDDEIVAVAGDATNIDAVAGDLTNIDAVAADLTNVDAVAGNEANIDAVAGNESNINTVAGIASDVSTVASNDSNVTTVATNISDVNDCATNMAAIQGASAAAESAAASAAAAAISAAGTHLKLFHHDWFDYELNDLAWLRADTFSWQDGEVYADAFNHLNADFQNGTDESETIGSYTIDYVLAPDGHKIVLPNMETTVANIYAESGVAWYYVLDRVNDRFKLPRENPNKEILELTAEVMADHTKLTTINANNNAATAYKTIFARNSTSSPGAAWAYQTTQPTEDFNTNLYADLKNKNGIYKGKQYLYFYVGNYKQSAIEQTAGLNAELFNGKVDLDLDNINPSANAKSYFAGLGMPSDMYETISATPYTAPANGWVTGAGLCAGNVWAFLSVSVCESTSTSDNDKVKYRDICWCGTAGNGMFVTTPVKKGDKVFWGSANFTLNYVKFIYAEGEV